MLSLLARVWLIRLVFGSQSRRRGRSSYGGSPYLPGRRTYGYGRRRRSEGFGLWGPFPAYSRRTRGGGRVSVGGCCLPIPLGLALAIIGAVRALTRR
jgi:hypothetical protein